MTMTNDTLKSLGFLKKSLKMNFKAMGKNASQDGIDATELATFAGHSKAMFEQIEVWEKAVVPVALAVVVPSGVVQPPAAASVINTVPDNDLLTID